MRRREDPAYAVPPIDAFGEGGFRVAGARRDGHVLIIDGTTKAWSVDGDPKALTASDFHAFLARADKPDMVVLGLGEKLVHPPADVRKAFREAGVGLEMLDTATACRTYNLLAGEARRVCAALIAV
ncbi:MAG: Mth938-like domain-containing protein [Alphaproteobacteria bacterium]|nr:Mth938-like domain-containing protein [Alphaproteobacteria bacterium]